MKHARYTLLLTLLAITLLVSGVQAVDHYEYYIGNDTVEIWNGTAGTTTWTPPSGVYEIFYLIIGGGGGGGAGSGAGGGGAGGYLTNYGGTPLLIDSSEKTIVVGAGGARPTGANLRGGTGGDSSFTGLDVVKGGGGGAAESGETTPTQGGSGGGAKTGGTGADPLGTQGTKGGDGGGDYFGGGGGGATGAGVAGSSGSSGGDGGHGIESAITGVSTHYAGGGGGMRQVNPSSAAPGGTGGGGAGGWYDTSYHGAIDGTDGLGGGGGAAHSTTNIGKGGSGIVIIRYNNQTTADFTANKTIGVVPLTIQFNDTSSMINIQSWNWSAEPGHFFNTTIPSARNLSYTYTKAGIYNVTLTIQNATRSNSLTRINLITAYNSTTATFSQNKTKGYPTLPIQFTNNDENSTSWYWEFGDGTTSTSENPIHSYTAPGTYQVNHSATNPAMTAWDNTSSITVYNPATIQFNPNTAYAGTLTKNTTVFLTVQNLTDIQAIRINVNHQKLWIESINPEENTTYFSGAFLESSTVDNLNGRTIANFSGTTPLNSPVSIDKPIGEIHYSYYNETTLTTLPLSFNEAQYLFDGIWYNFQNTNTGAIIPQKEYNIILSIKSSQTLSLITSMVSINWNGQSIGTGSTTTGLYNLSSPNGTVLVFFTTPGYQAYSATYTVNGIDQSQTVYLTEEEGVSIVESPPKSVRFHVQGLWGDPLDNVIVTAQAISTPLGDWDWLASLLGYPIGEIPLNNTLMGGTTDSQGDIAFLMMESTKYNVTSSKAGYTFDPLIIYPHDERYFIIAKQNGTGWYTGNYDYLKVINISVKTEEVSATEGFVNITYLDPLGGTTSGTIKVMQRSMIAGTPPTLIAEHPINSAYAFCSTYIVHTGPDMYDGYVISNLTNSNVGGPVNITKTFWFKGEPMTLPGIDAKVSFWFALFIIVITAMMGGASHASKKAFIVCFESWVFYGIGCFSSFFTTYPEWAFVTSLTFATFISLLWIWGERKRKEKY